MKTLRWVGGVLLLAALVAAAWWGFSRSQQPDLSYRTAKIERGSLQSAVSASGTVTPVTQVQVSSQVSGQIKELYVDFNSLVKEGQLIAQLDPETFDYRVRQSTADLDAARASVLTAQANVQSALAQVTRAQVDVSEAQRDERRKLDLLAQNFISPAELDSAKAKALSAQESWKVTVAQVDVARAQAQTAAAVVRQRDAQLQQARVDLQRTQIRSPVDGIVIKRSVEVGQTVAASLQAPELFVIARNLSDMQVEAAIDEADISRVRDAQKVSFTIDAFPGRSFDGSVKQVRKAAVSAQNVVSYTVVVGFANPGSLMLPGMTANVRIITDTRDDVLKLPNAALRVRIAGVEPATPSSSGPGAPGAASAPVRSGAASGFGWLPSAQAQGGAGALRARLVDGLQLNDAQQVQLDAVLAELRPRFVALRDLPEEQRADARDKVLGELRSRLNTFLTPAQRDTYGQMQAQAAQARVAGAAVPTPSPAALAAAPAAPALLAKPGPAAAPAAALSPAGLPAPAAPAAPALPTPPTASAPPAAAAPKSPGSAANAGNPANASAGPAGGLPSGPLRDLRQRLVAELGLSAAQVEQVDAVFAAQRPRFAELRNLAEADRPKARERILADMRAQIAERLTPEQQVRYQTLQAELAGRQSTRGRVYVLDADGKPRAYNVRLGISDGVMTELIVAPNTPEAAVLVEGAMVVTAVITGSTPAAGAARPANAPPGPRLF